MWVGGLTSAVLVTVVELRAAGRGEALRQGDAHPLRISLGQRGHVLAVARAALENHVSLAVSAEAPAACAHHIQALRVQRVDVAEDQPRPLPPRRANPLPPHHAMGTSQKVVPAQLRGRVIECDVRASYFRDVP